ncbi:MAG: hypothetical protein WBP64_09130 [Nitrososphaeraceae archaeon]
MEEKILKVIICVSNKGTLTNVLQEHHVDIGCTGGIRLRDDDRFLVQAYAPATTIERLRKPDIEIKVLGDAVSSGRERQKEVGNGNRFADLREIPTGFGIKE